MSALAGGGDPVPVVQLRIHGVGGATPGGLLGLGDHAETIRVAGDEAAGFYARPSDPRVQGYVWWKLTAGAWSQALWVILLPFTLFNVANWMFPREEDLPRPEWARVATRVGMFLLGVSLTLTYLLWEFTLVAQQAFYQWALGGLLDQVSLRVRALYGIAAVAAIGIVVYVVARRTRKDFEEVKGPQDTVDPALEPDPAVVGFPVRPTEQFGDRFFWAHARDSRRLLYVHMGIGAVLFAGLASWALLRAGDGLTFFNMRLWFRGLGSVQVVLLVVLFGLYFAGWGLRGAFRFAPPLVVAIVSLAITNGFFSGLTLYIAHNITLDQARSPLSAFGTLDFDQRIAFAFGAIVFLLALITLVWALVHGRLERLDRLMDERDTPCNTAPTGAEPNGVSPSMLQRVALVRSLSNTLRHIDRLLTPSAIAFLLVALVGLAPGVDLERDMPSWLRWLDDLGGWLVTAATGFAVTALVLRSFRPNANSKVKIVWDATTFWPRRFHPFAVRPYAERAVPEIQGRLYQLIEREESRVVVAAHSQGSILAYVALARLGWWKPEVTREIALVTFGSPLLALHARYFPAHFRYPEDFEALRRLLFEGETQGNGWINFYRRTDYVGQRLFVDPAVDGVDLELPDPPQLPRFAGRSVGQSWPLPPDAPPPSFTKLVVHSFYNNAVELRAGVDALQERLARR